MYMYLDCSYMTVTFVVEAMAAANAVRRWKRIERLKEVIYFCWILKSQNLVQGCKSDDRPWVFLVRRPYYFYVILRPTIANVRWAVAFRLCVHLSASGLIRFTHLRNVCPAESEGDGSRSKVTLVNVKYRFQTKAHIKFKLLHDILFLWTVKGVIQSTIFSLTMIIHTYNKCVAVFSQCCHNFYLFFCY